MSYKLKSLVYLSFLIITLVVYNKIDSDNITENTTKTVELNEINDINVDSNKKNQLVHLSEE